MGPRLSDSRNALYLKAAGSPGQQHSFATDNSVPDGIRQGPIHPVPTPWQAKTFLRNTPCPLLTKRQFETAAPHPCQPHGDRGKGGMGTADKVLQLSARNKALRVKEMNCGQQATPTSVLAEQASGSEGNG